MFLALLYNAALLLALVVVFEQTVGRARPAGRAQLLAAGLAVGAVAVGVMALPVPFVGGVVFDARSVLLGLAGLFFHPLVAVVAGVVAAAYRLWMGGIGALPGVAVVATSLLIGSLARRRWRDRLDRLDWPQLYALGWVLQVATLGWIATVPQGAGPAAVRAIALPSLAILPVATAALGWLLARRLRQERLVQDVRASEERLRRALDTSPVPMMLVDERGALVYVGASWLEATGYRPEQLRTMADWLRLGFDEDARAVPGALRRAFATDASREPIDRPVRLADGREAVWSFASAPLDPVGDGPRLAVLAATDVTARRDLERERRLAALVFDAASEPMVLTDAHNRVLKANAALRTVTGYAPEEVVGRSVFTYRSPRHPPDHYAAIEEALARDGRWGGEIWSQRRDGTEYLAEVSIATTSGEDGATDHRVFVFADVTDRKAAEERVWRQANFDALTGLPNRRLLHERLRQELDRAERAGTSVAVLLLDLDRFKDVNDALGHGEGDALLVEVARRIEGCVRSSDVVARMGGDEFALVLPEADDGHGVERVVADLLRAIAAPVRLREDVVFPTASVGITVFPTDGTTIADLLKNADQALYAAKDTGRDRWSYFAPEMERAAQDKRALVRDLRTAVAERTLDLAYQPLVDLATGRVTKVEALLRWTHPERGPVPPSDFVPVAEDTGLILPIGAWVLDEALAQVARWRAAGHQDLAVGVNVSPVQFVAEAIPWRERLAAHGLPGDALVVEITERLLLDERPQVAAQLLELRALGVAVALDDFGTGYSSLAYLKRLDIDFLKIDRAFVRDLDSNANDLALNEAIVVMAHRLGLKVVAEGIETAEQARLLRAAGCDLGQGYWFARPVPAATIDGLLGARLPKDSSGVAAPAAGPAHVG